MRINTLAKKVLKSYRWAKAHGYVYPVSIAHLTMSSIQGKRGGLNTNHHGWTRMRQYQKRYWNSVPKYSCK